MAKHRRQVSLSLGSSDGFASPTSSSVLFDEEHLDIIDALFDAHASGNVLDPDDFSRLVNQAIGQMIACDAVLKPSSSFPKETFVKLVEEAEKQGRRGELVSVTHPPLSRKAFAFFDTNCDGVVDKQEFIRAVSILKYGDWDDKLQFAFSVYDQNGGGFISRADMFDFLKPFFVGGVRLAIDLVTAFPQIFLADQQLAVVSSGHSDVSQFLSEFLGQMSTYLESFADDQIRAIVKDIFKQVNLKEKMTLEDFKMWAMDNDSLKWLDDFSSFFCSTAPALD